VKRTASLASAVLFLLSASPALAGAKCTFAAGALPSESSPTGLHGAQIPVEHILVLMQENRSFDTHLGKLHDEGQPRSRPVPKHASNPDPLDPSMSIAPFHQDLYCEVADLDHSWNGSHHEYDGGKMDGFTAANVNTNDSNGSRTMGYHDNADLPFYYGLYSTFAMADRYFCSVLSQTFPNRFFLLAATSFGHIANDFPQDCAQPCDPGTEYAQRSIFNVLDEAVPPVTWKVYFSEIPFADEFAYVRTRSTNVVPIDQYYVDAMTGQLPQVAFIDPLFVGSSNTENDEHPTANIQVGEQFVEQVVNALMTSPEWSSSVLFLTYDEHGGFYDHVKPPAACTPDDIPPMIAQTDEPGEFDRYGFRVPFVAISPYSKAGYVSHKVYDHTSILRFIETRFDLPALTRRDANARPLLELFNFDDPPFMTPPTLPAAPLDQAHFDAPSCAEGTGSGGL